MSSSFDLKQAPIITEPEAVTTDFVVFGAPSVGALAPVLIRVSALGSGGGGGAATNLDYISSTRTLTSSTGTDVVLPVVSPAAAGLAPASGGGTANFLRADGVWAPPPGGSGSTNLSYTASTRVVASSSGTGFTFPLMSSGDAGLAPASGGGTTNFLRADGVWAPPAGGVGGGTSILDAATITPTAGDFIPAVRDGTPGKIDAGSFLGGGGGSGITNNGTGARWTSLLEVPVALSSSSDTTANRLSLAPFLCTRSRVISHLAARITQGAASSNVGLAIYAHDATTGLPSGAPICSTGNLSSATSNSTVSSAITGGGSVTLTPGIYWMAIWASAANIQYQQTSMNNGSNPWAALVGSTDLNNVIVGNNSGGSEIALVISFNTSAWPNATGQSWVTNGFQNYCPFLYARGT